MDLGLGISDLEVQERHKWQADCKLATCIAFASSAKPSHFIKFQISMEVEHLYKFSCVLDS
jgi:hypothetical protein